MMPHLPLLLVIRMAMISFFHNFTTYRGDGNATIITSEPYTDSQILYSPNPDINGDRSFSIRVTDENLDFPKKFRNYLQYCY